MEKYVIGDYQFVWKENNYPLRIDNFMRKFFDNSKQNMDTIICETKYEDLERYSKGKLLEQNGLYELYELNQKRIIIYHWASCRFAFGFWLDDLEKENTMTYYFNPEMKYEISLDAVRFFSCAGIHSKLLQREALILHSSYVDWKGKSILFCGKSGVGKSTQASLWKKYEEAEVINGDRTLIKFKNGSWQSYGYPCCGSSGICINRTLPIGAIVLLEQGKDNHIEQLTMIEKMKLLISGSERYLWSETEMERIYQISKKMIKDIFIIKLVCRPDKDAVKVLRNWLED